MLFMFVCAVGSAWVGKKLDETRREQVAVAEIERLGGRVYYKGPDWFARHFRRVWAVRDDSGVIADSGLVHLNGLTRLNYLVLSGPQVTDVGLEHLKTSPRLAYLELRYTKVTDAGVEQFQQALQHCSINRREMRQTLGGEDVIAPVDIAELQDLPLTQP